MRIYTCSTCGNELTGQRRRCYSCHPGGSAKAGEQRTCQVCSKSFYVPRWKLKDIERNQGAYCSRPCRDTAMLGRPSEKALPVGSRRVRPDGYIEVKARDSEGRWILEHRFVAEQILGRSLATNEHVHHINGDRADNRAENLQVLTNAEHQHVHRHWLLQTKQVALTCETCGKAFTKKPSRVTKHNFCSNACRLGSGVAVDAMLAARGFPVDDPSDSEATG